MLDLSQVDHISLDTETTGLDRHGSDLPVGVSIASDAGDHYFSFGHQSENNCTVAKFRTWAKRELRGKKVSLVNPSLDLHMLKKIGVNAEVLRVVPRGVQYKCALIDEKRREYDLDSMARDFLGKLKKEAPCKPEDIWKAPGSLISDYAKYDARLTLELDRHFEPKILKQDLGRVAQLEDDLIFPVLHMELQGAILDVPKLHRWDAEVSEAILKLTKALGGLNPNAPSQMEERFTSLGFTSYNLTAKSGRPTFDKNNLKLYRQVGNPKVQALCDAVLALRAVISLKSKSTEKFSAAVVGDILRYHLHQCRTGDNGTVSGRFSASRVNIQQVSSPDKQDHATMRWIIRELFLPSQGASWLCADASQIEFRLFAHYSGSKRLQKAYRDDPDTDFHAVIAEMTSLIRKLAKNVNFGMVYGMGRAKYARDMQIPMDEADVFFDQYDERFPEAKGLMSRAMNVARKRGYVKTLLGRRRRFEDGRMLHAALNAVLQGSAADIMKLKIVKLYREMKHLDFNLRFTVHDEVDGDIFNLDRVEDIKGLLNEQEFDLTVPITWNVGTGLNWKEAA